MDAGRQGVGSRRAEARPGQRGCVAGRLCRSRGCDTGRGHVRSRRRAAHHPRSPDELIAEYDEERPARRLSPRLDRVVVALCFLASVFVLWQVFAPLQRGNQYYLILFLAAVLPLVFVCYRATGRRPGERDDPGVVDWVLAAVALVVALYPVLPVGIGDAGDAFLDRQGSLSTVDIVMGALLTLLVLEACRRTTGPVLP